MGWLRERFSEPSTLASLGILVQLGKTLAPAWGEVIDGVTATLAALAAVKKG